jgi:hypothetical protein
MIEAANGLDIGNLGLVCSDANSLNAVTPTAVTWWVSPVQTQTTGP